MNRPWRSRPPPWLLIPAGLLAALAAAIACGGPQAKAPQSPPPGEGEAAVLAACRLEGAAAAADPVCQAAWLAARQRFLGRAP